MVKYSPLEALEDNGLYQSNMYARARGIAIGGGRGSSHTRAMVSEGAQWPPIT